MTDEKLSGARGFIKDSHVSEGTRGLSAKEMT